MGDEAGPRAGLCSVTLRHEDPAGVLRWAAAAGLACVEWGGDVHVPPGDLARAAEVAARTRDAGLAVASYGSYHRPGDGAPFDDVLATAVALGAPRVRVWAGRAGSAEVDPARRERVVAESAAAAALAASAGVEVAFEFHGGTLTDTPASTLALLDDVPGASTYWQPPVDAGTATALAGLHEVLPRTSAAHVFSWWPGTTRRPLAERADLWRPALAALARAGVADALLEFVPDDRSDLLPREAATLRGWLGPPP